MGWKCHFFPSLKSFDEFCWSETIRCKCYIHVIWGKLRKLKMIWPNNFNWPYFSSLSLRVSVTSFERAPTLFCDSDRRVSNEFWCSNIGLVSRSGLLPNSELISALAFVIKKMSLKKGCFYSCKNGPNNIGFLWCLIIYNLQRKCVGFFHKKVFGSVLSFKKKTLWW